MNLFLSRAAIASLSGGAPGTPGSELPPRHATARSTVSLLACGLVVVLFAALYDFVVPLTPGRRQLASARLINRTELWRHLANALTHWVPGRVGVTVTWIVIAVVVAVCAYSAGVWLLWRRSPTGSTTLIVFGIGAALIAAAILAMPNTSTDIYQYLVTARLLAAHGANPVLIPPDAFPHDPLWPFAGHQYTGQPDNKLGVWIVFSLPAAVLGGGDPVRSLMLLRVALGVVALANLVLIWCILRRTAPAHACAGTAVFGWNPLVAMYSVGKTDTLMAFCFLLFVLLALNARERLATVPATASVLVKLLSAPFALPLVVGQVRRTARPVREVALRLSLAVVVTLGVYQVLGRDPLLPVRQALKSNAAFVVMPWPITAGVLVGLALLMMWSALQQDGTVERYLVTSVPIALYGAALLPYVGSTWYIMVPLALLAVVRNGAAAAAVVVISLAHALYGALDSADTAGFHANVLPRSAIGLSLVPALVVGVWLLQRIRVTWPSGPATVHR